MTDYFISDTHFGHKGILNIEPMRGTLFNAVEEMNSIIIENWNSIVNKNDRVFHLGDFCFGKKNIEMLVN